MPKTSFVKQEHLPQPFNSDEDRWMAVRQRDPKADGQFYYSVATTGVFCRPSCPSRLAKREHVSFHHTPDEALRAGFRPCKRCKPEQPTLAEQHATTIARTCELIINAEASPTLAVLAHAAGMSRYHFHRVFKAITGLTPKAYATAHRAKRVRAMLARRGDITEVIYSSGFNSAAPFYASSSQTLGMTPTNFSAGGANTIIRFALGKCTLGNILVAATDKGVCAISLGDDPEILVRELQDQFPRAEFIGDDSQFKTIVSLVVGFVEAPALGLQLPLDVRGTVFQHRVWQALRGIPSGTTASYSDIAKRIGSPKAGRAVAQACAANTIAVAIPCHRVVRHDGAISGYRWGVERKRRLLRREGNK